MKFTSENGCISGSQHMPKLPVSHLDMSPELISLNSNSISRVWVRIMNTYLSWTKQLFLIILILIYEGHMELHPFTHIDSEYYSSCRSKLSDHYYDSIVTYHRMDGFFCQNRSWPKTMTQENLGYLVSWCITILEWSTSPFSFLCQACNPKSYLRQRYWPSLSFIHQTLTDLFMKRWFLGPRKITKNGRL